MKRSSAARFSLFAGVSRVGTWACPYDGKFLSGFMLNIFHRAARPRRHWAVALGATAVAVPCGVGVLWAVGFVFATAAGLPDLEAAPPGAQPQATVLYAADGSVLARYYREYRTAVDYEAISPHVVHALIATEDRRFYTHPGVDPRRLVGAALATLRGDRQGGSTITMQLVRNRYVSVAGSPPFVRKLEEILMALRIGRRYDKKSILEMYLNTVSFGRRAFGIAAAAHVYFGKPPRALNLLESATLVGMLKATTYYDPVRHPERARRRRNVVLRQMVEYGYLSHEVSLRHRTAPIDLHVQPRGIAAGPAPHFAEFVRRRAEDWAARHGYDLYTDGLHIYTTLGPALQRAAREAVRTTLPSLEAVAAYEWSRPTPRLLARDPAPYVRRRKQGAFTPFAYLWQSESTLLDAYVRRAPRYRRLVRQGLPPDTALARLRQDAAFMQAVKAGHARVETGLVALDPRTGAVRAWVGSRDFLQDQYDHVALARRQPGSTFKPFVWAAAVGRGYAPADTFVEAGTRLALRDGLAYSSNRMALHLIRAIGPSAVAALAHEIGIQSPLHAFPSLALGTSEVRLLELAGAYGTLAAYGTHHPPYAITRIEDGDGRVLARFRPEPRAVLTPYTAYTVLDMMRGVVAYGTGVALRGYVPPGADLAGKTGTTQNNADGWFLAVHPQLVTGAWVGFNDRRIHFRTRYWGHGSSNALRVVGAFLQRAFARGLLAAAARFMPPPGYRTPAPRPPAPSDSGYVPLFASDGEMMRDAFALGLDSARALQPRSPLARRAAHPAAALREALDSASAEDSARATHETIHE